MKIACAALGFIAAAALAGCAHQPADGGWVTLFDGTSLDAFNRVGNANWTVTDGVVTKFAKSTTPMKAAGKWNTYEITAKGDHLVVVLNGVKTVDMRDGKFASGPIALQSAAGTIRFRKVEVRPL